MKNIPFFLFALSSFFFACSNEQPKEPTPVIDKPIEEEEVATPLQLDIPQLTPFLDSMNVEGAVIVFNADSNTYWGNSFDRAYRGFLPASTYKIVNSIIALETGVVPDKDTVFTWNGEPRRLQSWEQDLTFEQAFHYSCVPCYQQVARMIGPERMNASLDKLGYNNMIVNDSTIDQFWLVGESQISQMEQIEFLRRFYFEELPITEQTYHEMKAMMVIEKNDEYTLSGKTGWSIQDGKNNGWFVGYLEKNGTVFFFATNIEPKPNSSIDLFSSARRLVNMHALRAIDIID